MKLNPSVAGGEWTWGSKFADFTVNVDDSVTVTGVMAGVTTVGVYRGWRTQTDNSNYYRQRQNRYSEKGNFHIHQSTWVWRSSSCTNPRRVWTMYAIAY